MKKKQMWGIVIAGVVFIAVCVTGVFSNVLAAKMTPKQDSTKEIFSNVLKEVESNEMQLPKEDFVGTLNIVGTIQESSGNDIMSGSSGEYNHDLNMKYIDQLMEADNNKGIFLYVNSPGGAVYQSDELYLKLLEYKEKTKRPVYAYFGPQACSGAYYIAMAADKIYANRNCWTGSIGVIVSLMNCEKLYKKIGIKEIDITSGKNKSMGSMGLELTEEQRDILQDLVDEAYEQFTEIVSDGRSMDISIVKKLADGRIYSAKQAKDNGLIDEIGSEEDMKKAIAKENKWPEDITYQVAEKNEFDFLSSLMGRVENLLPKSDLDLGMDIVNNKGNGVLMYYAE